MTKKTKQTETNNTIGNFIDFVRVQWELGKVIADPKEAKAFAKLLQGANAQWNHMRESTMEFTGHTIDFDEAIEEMMAIREALAETFDENQKLEAALRKADNAFRLAERVIEEFEKGGTLFAPAGIDSWLDELERAKQVYYDKVLTLTTPAFSQEIIEALKPLLTGNKIDNADMERARKVYFALASNKRSSPEDNREVSRQ